MTKINDKAIEKVEDDLLNRYSFAEKIAEKIIHYNSKDSLTIGILGKWGCGKSSVLNMVETKLLQNKDEIITIRYNPWNFSNDEQLVSNFFKILSNKLNKIDDKEEFQQLSKKLKSVSQLLKTMSAIPQLSIVTDPLGKGVDLISGLTDFYVDESFDDLHTLKDEINGVLITKSQKIVVIIDEIDRLESNAIKEIFKLVRSVGDFNNVIYMLAYDDTVINKMFRNENREYIDKIINIPIHIPKIKKEVLNNILQDEVIKLLELNNELNSEYWRKTFKTVFENQFDDLRQVSRFLGVFEFDNSVNGKEICQIDMLTVTYLRMFNEKLYDYIWENGLKYDVNKTPRMSNGDKSEKLISLLNCEERKNSIGLCNKKYFYTYFNYHLADGVYSKYILDQYKLANDIRDIERLVTENGGREVFYSCIDEVVESLPDMKKADLVLFMINDIELGKIFDSNREYSKKFLSWKLREVIDKTQNCYDVITSGLVNIKNTENFDINSLIYIIKILLEKSPKYNSDIKVMLVKMITNNFSSDVCKNMYLVLDELPVVRDDYINTIIQSKASYNHTVETIIGNVKLVGNHNKDDILKADIDLILGWDNFISKANWLTIESKKYIEEIGLGTQVNFA